MIHIYVTVVGHEFLILCESVVETAICIPDNDFTTRSNCNLPYTDRQSVNHSAYLVKSDFKLGNKRATDLSLATILFGYKIEINYQRYIQNSGR